jgi:hypothetical protein
MFDTRTTSPLKSWVCRETWKLGKNTISLSLPKRPWPLGDGPKAQSGNDNKSSSAYQTRKEGVQWLAAKKQRREKAERAEEKERLMVDIDRGLIQLDWLAA